LKQQRLQSEDVDRGSATLSRGRDGSRDGGAEEDEEEDDLSTLLARVQAAAPPPEVLKAATKEYRRLLQMGERTMALTQERSASVRYTLESSVFYHPIGH
jgi:hypothetical protein